MENKDKEKKDNDNSKAHRPKEPLKDLHARKEDANKVQGGGGTYGPEPD
jgi:hypothetical protein